MSSHRQRKTSFMMLSKSPYKKMAGPLLTIPCTRLVVVITTMYIDLGAEKVIAAEKEGGKIAVEIKSFLGPSTLTEFHLALGQFMNYRYALADTEPDRVLYLAVPLDIYEEFFTLAFIQSVLRRSQLHLLVYDVGTEEITQWHP